MTDSRIVADDSRIVVMGSSGIKDELDALIRASEPQKKKSTYTDAKKRANARWAKTKAQIAIRVAPEVKQKIENHISENEEGLAAFMVRAALEQIERDQEK